MVLNSIFHLRFQQHLLLALSTQELFLVQLLKQDRLQLNFLIIVYLQCYQLQNLLQAIFLVFSCINFCFCSMHSFKFFFCCFNFNVYFLKSSLHFVPPYKKSINHCVCQQMTHTESFFHFLKVIFLIIFFQPLFCIQLVI